MLLSRLAIATAFETDRDVYGRRQTYLLRNNSIKLIGILMNKKINNSL